MDYNLLLDIMMMLVLNFKQLMRFNWHFKPGGSQKAVERKLIAFCSDDFIHSHHLSQTIPVGLHYKLTGPSVARVRDSNSPKFWRGYRFPLNRNFRCLELSVVCRVLHFSQYKTVFHRARIFLIYHLSDIAEEVDIIFLFEFVHSCDCFIDYSSFCRH